MSVFADTQSRRYMCQQWIAPSHANLPGTSITVSCSHNHNDGAILAQDVDYKRSGGCNRNAGFRSQFNAIEHVPTISNFVCGVGDLTAAIIGLRMRGFKYLLIDLLIDLHKAAIIPLGQS